MIDGDRLLRKMRKTKLDNDITAYKMKRNAVNICLEKPNRNTTNIYWMKIFNHRTDSGKQLMVINLSKLTQSLPQIKRSFQMALLTSIPKLFQN